MHICFYYFKNNDKYFNFVCIVVLLYIHSNSFDNFKLNIKLQDLKIYLISCFYLIEFYIAVEKNIKLEFYI